VYYSSFPSNLYGFFFFVPKFDHPLTPILVLNKFGPNHPGISKNRRDSAQVSVNAKWHNRSFGECVPKSNLGTRARAEQLSALSRKFRQLKNEEKLTGKKRMTPADIEDYEKTYKLLENSINLPYLQ
jgi:hypothetical protein